MGREEKEGGFSEWLGEDVTSLPGLPQHRSQGKHERLKESTTELGNVRLYRKLQTAR